jgi:hypothetical protein
MDPWAAVGLDPDQHRLGLVVVVKVVGDQSMQLGQPGHPFRQPAPNQYPTLVVLQLDVVMDLGPVIAQELHHGLLPVVNGFVPRKTAAP